MLKAVLVVIKEKLLVLKDFAVAQVKALLGEIKKLFV